MQTSDHTQVKGFQILQRLGEDALADDKLRRQLIADPRSVLERRGVTLPKNVEVVIHQNTSTLIHLVLPAAPTQSDFLNVDEVRLKTLIGKHPF